MVSAELSIQRKVKVDLHAGQDARVAQQERARVRGVRAARPQRCRVAVRVGWSAARRTSSSGFILSPSSTTFFLRTMGCERNMTGLPVRLTTGSCERRIDRWMRSSCAAMLCAVLSSRATLRRSFSLSRSATTTWGGREVEGVEGGVEGGMEGGVEGGVECEGEAVV